MLLLYFIQSKIFTTPILREKNIVVWDTESKQKVVEKYFFTVVSRLDSCPQ